MIAPAVPAARDADDITDHELVARIRRGDDRAFECLYRRYHRRIAGYIQGMVHDHGRAEDIAQDVFMSALRRMRDTDRPIAFKPWIYEIAKNACIDQFRRSRRAEEVSYDAEEGLGSADYGRLVTKDPSPEVRYDQKQQLDHLRGAFGGLSETHHEILVMRELEGLSYREIGERMGMTRPAVESTLFRARRRLSEEYEELVTGERCQRVQGIIATAGSGELGARDRRRVARHISYCQACLRHARTSGMDASDLVAKPVRAKIAALLPLPAFLKRKLGADEVALPDVSGLHTWSAQVGSLDPGVVSGWGKAVATAATIAIAGVGAGVAADPPGDVRAAIGGPAISERLGGGEDGERSRDASARDARGSSSSSPAREPSGAAGTERRTRRATSTGAPGPERGAGSGAGTPSVSAPSSPGSDRAADAPAAGEPAADGSGLADALSRLGAGGSGDDEQSSGSSGGSAPSGQSSPFPAIVVPGVTTPGPSTSGPPGDAPSTAPSSPADVVASTVESAQKSGTTVGSAAEGILAGE